MDEISKYWRVYQRALMPKTAPHNPPLYNEQMLRKYLLKHRLLFARWITNFDCGYETEWYHVIKDEPFDISTLKAKRRYEVNKGNKNYYTKIIFPFDFKQDIENVIKESYKSYPLKYRPIVDEAFMSRCLKEWSSENVVVIGVFDKNEKRMRGFACLNCLGDYINYFMHKVLPQDEKKAVNAALVYGALQYWQENKKYKYITDGQRAIKHETNFQDYLIKYFEFRKAYCQLHVLYNPVIKPVIIALYPMINILSKFCSNGIIYNIYCVLKQEEIRRSFL